MSEYWIEFSVRPADSDDPGFANGVRAFSLEQVEPLIMLTLRDPEWLAKMATQYLRQNGYR